MYRCECGKEFEHYRQYNGHRSSHFRGEQYKLKRAAEPKTAETFICKNCGKTHNICKNARGFYCSVKCQQDFQYTNTIKQWLDGKIVIGDKVPLWLRRYLRETRGFKCEICGISEWLGNQLTLDLDHIDGNYANNSIENLRYLCPNCHSQTPTYKSKNKGKGRAARRKSPNGRKLPSVSRSSFHKGDAQAVGRLFESDNGHQNLG